MWVRSQDKKFLGECKRLVISNKNEILNYVSYGEYEDYDILGKYESEERSLEVLDEIAKSMEYWEGGFGIYQMPEK